MDKTYTDFLERNGFKDGKAIKNYFDLYERPKIDVQKDHSSKED